MGLPAGDAAKGAKVFKSRAAMCHTKDQGGANGVGPNLWGIVGRDAATIEGFAYSPCMKASGVTWTEEKLDVYLENPKKMLPATKMAFAGLKKPADRANIIEFLKTLA